MQRRQRICVYGNSLILATLGASLRRVCQFEVTALVEPFPNATELIALEPDVILFDLQAARPEAAFALLESQLGLLLVGVSPDKNVVRIWSGRQLSELSTQDLMRVLSDRGSSNSDAEV